MSQELIMGIARETAMTVLLVGGPLMLIAMIIGLSVTIFQTVTQLRDQTLTFIPKIVGIVLALIFFLNWIINSLTGFATKIFTMARYIT